tara:strand:+ start:8328 stop:9029 length:702 start_codon:yes stop_codon:yes gene_type:complete
MDIKKVIFYVLIFIVLFSLYKWLFRDSTTTNLVDMQDATTHTIIPQTKLNGKEDSTYFTYSFWVYISSWTQGEKIIIERKGTPVADVCPKISLSNHVNDLDIRLATSSGASGGTGSVESYKVKNIPLQKWTHVVITTTGQSMDAYIDGKLVKTFLLSGPPKISGEGVHDICPKKGYDGFIAKVRYYSRSLNPREVYELYKEGPSKGIFGNMLGKYKLRFSYSKDNKEEGVITI